MLKIKKKSENYSEEVVVRKEKSGVSDFINHSLPTEEEVEEFEKIVEDESRESEIDESLSEIYKDEKGNTVDVGSLNIKKKQGLLFWFLNIIFTLVVMAGLGYGAYYYIYHNASDSTALDFSVAGPEKVLAGEEFFATVEYKNFSRVSVKNARIEITYPENFVFLDSLPQASEKNSAWQINDLPVGASGSIKIKGKIVNGKGTNNILLAKMLYTPENFSSEFKKESSRAFLLEDIGLDFDFSYSSSVLAGEENEIAVKIKSQEKNFLSQFKITIDPSENLELISVATTAKEKESEPALIVEKTLPNSWNISGLGKDEQELKIKYKINNKVTDNQDIVLRFENSDGDKSYSFLENRINVEVMKSDLSLTLIANGSKNDQAVKFGDKLNYSIVFANKGKTSMKDMVIMAVLEGDLLDWSSLNDENKGGEKGNSIFWTKEEIPVLAELKSDEEGVIDFSVNIASFDEKYLGYSVNDLQIKSYVKFSIGNQPISQNGSTDNRSNTIINKINSDLSLKEEVRYFNQDNVPVGTGPLPPKVGQTTSFKVYWTLTNNLHELQDARVEVILPANVNWDNKNRTSVGTVKYDAGSRKVTWQIGRLPISVYRADAEFSISLTPTESDRNKIMVLLPGSKASALDIETQGQIESATKAKTTKLDDDEIASMNSDGRVE